MGVLSGLWDTHNTDGQSRDTQGAHKGHPWDTTRGTQGYSGALKAYSVE
jgi:hypothetical protein